MDLYDAFLALVLVLICTSVIIFCLRVESASQEGYDKGFDDGFDLGYKKAQQELESDYIRVIRSA